jgi:phosphatidylglycerophosphatase A
MQAKLATLIATLGGAGLVRFAPGTVASALATVAAYGLAQGGVLILMAALVVALAAGHWATGIYLAGTQSHDPGAHDPGAHDPGEVVIDEVAGQWLALLFAPVDPFFYGLGFLAFRFFDIAKPWPISWAERHFKGAMGVMADDVLAGLAAGVVLLAINWGMGA